MKKKKKIEKLEQRIEALEKIITPSSITFTDPDNKESCAVIEIVNGEFTSYTLTTKTDKTNLTKTPL